MPMRRLTAIGLSFALATAGLMLLFQIVQAKPASQGFFAVSGNVVGTCAQAHPCDLQTAVSQANNGDYVYVAQGTYTGAGAAVISVTKTITLYGGWSGNASGRPLIDPATYTTTLDAQNSRRGIYIGSGITPTIDGFVIRNGNATGLIAGCSAPFAKGCGGGLFASGARLTLLRNTFISNTALVTTTVYGQGHGGGIYLGAGDGSIISGNIFLSNTGALPLSHMQGNGGGADVFGANSVDVIVQNNQFVGNSAPDWGGGLSLENSQANQVLSNLFQGNSSALGGGFYAWYAHALVSHNTFHDNTGDSAAYIGYFTGAFDDNLVTDNPATAGVNVIYGAGGDIRLVYNNIIAHNGAIGLSAAANPGGPLDLNLIDNTLVGSGSGTGIWVASGSVTVTAVNTLFSGFTTAVSLTNPATTTVNVDHSLMDTNIAGVGNASYTNNVFGSAAFVDPANRNYHIRYDSAARDAGTLTVVGFDIDGDTRPLGAGTDIGADETRFSPVAFLPVLRR